VEKYNVFIKGGYMKHFWKVGAALSMVLFFCMINVWVNADTRGAYQRAKDSAAGVYQKAKNTATGAYQTAKENIVYAKERASSAVSSGIQWMTGAVEPTAIRINPYKDTVATVRVGNELNTNERAYLEKRRPKVKAGFEKMLNRSLDGKYVPTMAIVGSGGGYRAMLGCLGSFSAAEKLGIMDATTYITALSGATWALAPWMSTGMSFGNFKKYIHKTVEKDIHVSSVGEAKNIIDMLSVKLMFDEPITIVDIYGGLLANRLLNHFGSDCQRVYLSQQVERIKNADVPFPIYTAIDAREAVSREPHWYEYTPYEIGTPSFGVYVPSWAYGRQFNNGQSTNFAPEQSLGFLMGTWGSAFGVHFGRAWDEVVEKLPGNLIKSYVERKLVDPLTGKRINTTWAEIFNFMYGMPGQELAARPTIKFVDAGIDFNLPYPPVSGERPERKADIMIFLDFSGGSLISSMKKTEAYARRKGLKFPKVDYDVLETKAMSIFRDPTDPSVPVVIYFPRISDAQLWQENRSNADFKEYKIEGFDFDKCTNTLSGACGTTSFKYSERNAEKLMDQMEFNIMVHKDQIMEVINWVIDQKS